MTTVLFCGSPWTPRAIKEFMRGVRWLIYQGFTGAVDLVGNEGAWPTLREVACTGYRKGCAGNAAVPSKCPVTPA
jgi:hypothetical protein